MPLKHGRVHNFSAGPCALPVEVLEQCRDDMVNFKGTGMSIMEMSHRSKEFVEVYNNLEADIRDILSIPATHKFFLLQGGASLQFAGVPLNLLADPAKGCDYLVSGGWGAKACEEADKYSNNVRKVFDMKACNYTHIAPQSEWAAIPEDSNYAHYTSNETIFGVEWDRVPDVPSSVPLVCDASSDFISRSIDWSKHSAVYAGAQKNAGPAGNTVMIVDEKHLGKQMSICPSYTTWAVAAKGESMHNTPACYALYVMGLFAKHTRQKGGVAYWDEKADRLSNALYEAIDRSDGFYRSPVAVQYRSRMTIPFLVCDGDKDLEKKFLAEAKTQDLVTLAGHRSVGGLRAAIYNGVESESVDALISFMKDFATENRK